MKCSPLLPKFALVLAVAYACSDSMAPANSHPLVTPTHLAGILGKPPPPPVSTVIAVSIGDPEFAVFTGVYFSNGVIDEVGTPSETFDGTAWLRLDNNNMQPNLGGTATANTRFMVKDANPPTGMGTLFIAGHTFTIVSVQSFTHSADCGAPAPGFSASPCASINFMVTNELGVPYPAEAQAFDKASCLVPGEGGVGLIFTCGDF
jgi:hypothetical protein